VVADAPELAAPASERALGSFPEPADPHAAATDVPKQRAHARPTHDADRLRFSTFISLRPWDLTGSGQEVTSP
jgi:hypothetical protein